MKAKTLIVGGGIMGVSIAVRLAKASDPVEEPVVLLERQELGAGSSGRSGAVLRQHYADRPVAAMARDSLREYASFQTLTGRRIGFRRCGVLILAGGDFSPERLQANVEMQQSIGIRTEVVGAEEIRRLVPGIAVEDDAVGAWEPESGTVDALRTVRQFAALARTYGAITRMGVEVEELLVEGGRVTGVRTKEGVVRAERVVLAAGPWCGGLLESAGVDLPLRVVRPEQHFVALPMTDGIDETDELLQTAIRGADLIDPLERISEEASREEGTAQRIVHPVVIDLEQGFYARCELEGRRTRVGRTSYDADLELEDPDGLEESVGPEMARWSREVLVKRLPVYESLEDVGSEAAWYTVTPDAQPIVGPAPGVEGLLLVAGFSGHGFKLAPSVANGILEMVSGEPVTSLDREFFSPERFSSAPLAEGRAFGL